MIFLRWRKQDFALSLVVFLEDSRLRWLRNFNLEKHNKTFFFMSYNFLYNKFERVAVTGWRNCLNKSWYHNNDTSLFFSCAFVLKYNTENLSSRSSDMNVKLSGEFLVSDVWMWAQHPCQAFLFSDECLSCCFCECALCSRCFHLQGACSQCRQWRHVL